MPEDGRWDLTWRLKGETGWQVNADLLGSEIRSVIVLSLIQGMKKSCIWNLRVGKQSHILWKTFRLIGFVDIDRRGIVLPLLLYTTFRHINKITTAIGLLVITGCDDVNLLQHIWYGFWLTFEIGGKYTYYPIYNNLHRFLQHLNVFYDFHNTRLLSPYYWLFL